MGYVSKRNAGTRNSPRSHAHELLAMRAASLSPFLEKGQTLPMCTPELIMRVAALDGMASVATLGLPYCLPEELLTRPSFARILQRLPPRWFSAQGSCAVVASSGLMNGSRLGEAIDAHDVVLRMNAAPTKGHEDDVGSKTTLRLVSPDDGFSWGTALELAQSGDGLLLVPFNPRACALPHTNRMPTRRLRGARWPYHIMCRTNRYAWSVQMTCWTR